MKFGIIYTYEECKVESDKPFTDGETQTGRVWLHTQNGYPVLFDTIEEARDEFLKLYTVKNATIVQLYEMEVTDYGAVLVNEAE